ncbi:DUF2239 family protein [Pseudomonas lactis]|uniref:DUF2239 domain-containing protein n=3 Tax=Pseudomonas fluorescens TaxID=294 RepID=A0A2T0ICE3_PSEFL|nr:MULTISPECIES: DUF2239 family protein [Pseudomonas]MBA5956894.1 DUF2239 family protein [Pseudomonas lactis]MBC6624810.1 DUF2239 family protein [Pseudomonas sp.]MBH3466674.1 DUF2239 family protein [Pseudomonas carnis]MBJ2211769.1 DUF2239 family protein [Pseudomonas carnis]MBJ2227108.1 DUF2239 family protein [Pseudomonas sp. MF7451]
MPTQIFPLCTAFAVHQRIAAGTYPAVAEALADQALPAGSFLVFDDATGRQVDYPWPAGYAPQQPAQAHIEDEPPATPSVGRPKLGVVAREVTLLPRHWEWLGQQRGGASAALRRLVDEARTGQAGADKARQAKEASYRFMSAIGGNLPGFEDASRALFAQDQADFSSKIAHWPPDVRSYLAWLSRNAFCS